MSTISNTPFTMQNTLSKTAGQTMAGSPLINLRAGASGANLPVTSGASEAKVFLKNIPTDSLKQINLGDMLAIQKMKAQIGNILGNVPSMPSPTTTEDGNTKQVIKSHSPSTVNFVPQVAGGTAQTASTYLPWSDTAIPQAYTNSKGEADVQYVIVTNRYTSS